MQCPCCNSELHTDLLWSPELGTLANAAGCKTLFNKRQALMFGLLWEAAKHGKGVHAQKFIAIMYDDDEDGGALTAKSVAVTYITRVRQRIAFFGMDIKCRSSVYYLTLGHPTFAFDRLLYGPKNHNSNRGGRPRQKAEKEDAVARAIYEHVDDEHKVAPEKPWHETDEDQRRVCRGYARAVLLALKERNATLQQAEGSALAPTPRP